MMVERPLGRYWVIIHKPTGGTLPELSKKTSGGYTHTEPSNHLTPRLFMTARGARNALTWWLRGVVSTTHSQNYEGEWDESWSTDPKVNRKAEDMDVIPVSLSEIVKEIA